MLHKNVAPSENHVIHAWTVLSSTSWKTGGYVARDVGKIALETDTNQFWLLASITPAPSWVQLGGLGSGTLPIDQGGTGQTAGIAALNALGVPALDSQDGKVLTANGNTLQWKSLSDAQLAGILPIGKGGTGAADPTAALVALGVPAQTGQGGKLLTTDGTSLAWNTVPFSQITGTLPITQGGTGSATPTAALTALGVPSLDSQDNKVLTVQNGQLTWNPVPYDPTSQILPVAKGGTGAADSTAALVALGVPPLVSQDNKVLTVQNGQLVWNQVPYDPTSQILPVTKGGTGAADSTAALVALGVPAQTGQNGKLLTTDGSSLAWSTVPFSQITGTLPITQGGTGSTTPTAALTALGIPAISPADALKLLAVNPAGNGYVLTNNVPNTTGVLDLLLLAQGII